MRVTKGRRQNTGALRAAGAVVWIAVIWLLTVASAAADNTIGVQFLSNRAAWNLGWRPGLGAVVSTVAAGGPGAAAQIDVGDVVKAVNGYGIVDVEELIEIMEQVPPGTTVRLHVYCGHGRGEFVTWVQVLRRGRASGAPERVAPSSSPYRGAPMPPSPTSGTVVNPYTGLPDANLAYANGLNAQVAQANAMADQAIRSQDPDGRCSSISTHDPAFAQCVNREYQRKDPNLEYGRAWMNSVQRLSEQINEGERLGQACTRNVPGACAASDRHLAMMQERIRADAALAATLGGLASSSRITASITRMEQARTWQDFTRRATGFADGYAQWAADAAQAGRADLAAQYASAADHWSQLAGGRGILARQHAASLSSGDSP